MGGLELPDEPAPIPGSKREVVGMIESLRRLADLYKCPQMTSALTSFDTAFQKAKSKDLSGNSRVRCFIRFLTGFSSFSTPFLIFTLRNSKFELISMVLKK